MSYEDDKPLLEFPCEFPIKVVGLCNDSFEVTVLTIIRQHCPDLAETALKSRTSKNGKYLSITITINATSQEHLDAIYVDFTNNDEIIMAL